MKDFNKNKGCETIAPEENRQENEERSFPLGKKNMLWMAVSLAVIVLGFILMSGKPSGIDEFNPDIFSTRRIVVGPIISFIGFVAMAIAIFVKPKK